MSLDYPPECPSDGRPNNPYGWRPTPDDKRDDRPILADYLTRPDLAQELGVCARTIARYDAKREGPPSLMLGGRRLYHRERARQWLESKLIESVAVAVLAMVSITVFSFVSAPWA